MEPLPPVVVTDELRRAVEALIERLGSGRADAEGAWQAFGSACGLDPIELGEQGSANTAVIVGEPERVLNRARTSTEEFGFVMPAATLRRVWEREPSRFADPTMRLWRLGWSPVAIARIMVATDDGPTEIVVGNARPTPEVSALDDAD